jgi:RNA polymerase sigma factor (sigma-70 family)
MLGETLRRLIGQLDRARARQAADGLTDSELLRRYAQNRDEAAFEVLVWRHGATVLGTCRRLLGSCPDAEDAFQATFLTLVRKAGSIRNGAALPGWLHRVAHRIALQVRANRRQRSAREGPLLGEGPAVREPDAPDREALALLEEEVARLPAKYRLPVLMCYYQGQPTAEAARQLGCPRGTILSRLATARQRLRGRLTRRGVTLTAALGLLRLEQRALAAVPTTLVRKALPGAVIAEPVAALTEGVLRAMLLAKIKTAVVVVLTLGLIGAGAGGWAYRSALAAQAHTKDADKPAKEASKPLARPIQGDAEKPPRDIGAEKLKALREELQRAQDELEQMEDRGAKAKEDSQVQLMALEERFRLAEREQTRQRERELALLKDAGQELLSAQKAFYVLRNDFSKFSPPPDKAKEYEKALQWREDEVNRKKAALAEQDANFRKAEEKRTEEMIDLRTRVMVEQNRLEQIERRLAAQRQRAADRVETILQRIRQIEGPNPPVEAPNRQLMELIRKVDALQREVSELRRELRRTQPEREK